MSEFQIRKGGNLVKIDWVYDDLTKKGANVITNVTQGAPHHLFDMCTLGADVTLRDVFLLLKKNLDFYDLVFGNWCKEIVDEGFNGKKSKDQMIETLELSWSIEFSKFKESSTLDGLLFPDFHGRGKAEKSEIENGLFKEGDVISYGVSFTPASELLDLPLVLAECIVVDWKSHDVRKVDSGSYSLGQILYAIIWELSFHGGPKSRKKAKKNLMKMMDDVKGD